MVEINLLYLPFCSLIIENLTYPRVIKNRLENYCCVKKKIERIRKIYRILLWP